MLVVSCRRSSTDDSPCSFHQWFIPLHLNNEKFIHRNKTSTNSYIQVFILYWWCVLHVMKAFWCFFFHFSFLVSTVQPKFRVYGTSISGFKATRLKINNSGDQPVRVVDNQESPVLYSYCNDFVQTKSRSRVVVYISPKYMLLTFSLLSFSYGPIHFPILIQ